MSFSFPEKILVEEKAVSFPLTRRILENCPGIPFQVIRSRREIHDILQSSADPVGEAKKYLLLRLQRGAFVKRCPCTPCYIGCNYYIINAVWNCSLDCSYCILQLYLADTPMTVFVNRDDLWRELDRFLGRREGRFLRLGTGELADSLALDPLTQTAGEFVSYFRKRPSAVFELKTKTAHISGLRRREAVENVVVSWSLNSEKVAAAEEKGAPPVAERIEAARRVAALGFPVGFHFDPLVLCAGWEEDYAAVIEQLLRALAPSRIRWISLGSLRFPTALKPIIEKRFPASRIVYGELVPGKDRKLRYFKPLRLGLYRRVVDLIRYFGGQRIPLYFCMEDTEVWEKGLGWKPRRKADVELSLSPRLDDSKSIA
jgi:spore photoproduct lyase